MDKQNKTDTFDTVMGLALIGAAGIAGVALLRSLLKSTTAPVKTDPVETDPSKRRPVLPDAPILDFPPKRRAVIQTPRWDPPIFDWDTYIRDHPLQPVQPVFQTPRPAATPFNSARAIRGQHGLMQDRVVTSYNFPWSNPYKW